MFQVDKAPLQEIPIAEPSMKIQETIGALVLLLQLDGEAESSHANTRRLEELLDACIMECYFGDHMAGQDLRILANVAPHLSLFDPKASKAKQQRFLTSLQRALDSSSSPLRQNLDRICASSPDLLAVIREEGKL